MFIAQALVCSLNTITSGHIPALYDSYAVRGMLETVTEISVKVDKLVAFSTITSVDLYMAVHRSGIANPYLGTIFFLYFYHHTVERSTLHTY